MRGVIDMVRMNRPTQVVRTAAGQKATVISGPVQLTLEAYGDWTPEEVLELQQGTVVFAPLSAAPEKFNDAQLAIWAERGGSVVGALISEVYRLRDELNGTRRALSDAKKELERNPMQRLVAAARQLGLAVHQLPYTPNLSLIPFDTEDDS
jgi:hypothetical protein